MPEAAFLPLAQNAAFLLGLAVVYDVATSRWALRRGPFGPVAAGILIGLIGIVIMVTPWVLTPGVIFDTRSVLLAVAGLVFGPVPTIVAMAMTAALRISQGGEAMAVGVAVILASGTFGIAWGRLRRGPVEDARPGELYLLGLAVSLVMLALMLALPWAMAMRVLTAIAIPVLLIYPVATAALGMLLVSRLRRERTVAEMRVSEERLRLALSAGEQGLYDLDLRTGEATVNDEYAAMLGYDAATFHETNAAWMDRLHPDDREPVALAYRDYVAGRRPDYRVEFRQRTRSGGWKWILSLGEILEWDGAGTPVRMLGTHLDITKRRESEEQARVAEVLMAGLLEEARAARQALLSVVEDLRASEQLLRESANRYRGLITHAPDAIFVNRDDRLVLVNQACVALFGAATEQELLGRASQELFHPDDLAAIGERIHRLRDLVEPVLPREERIVRLDGRVVDVEVSASPFVEGDTVSIHVVLRDITERKRAEEALREFTEVLERRVAERTEDLQDANQELEAFAYSVSHDLRAPLRAVLGFAQILERRHAAQLDDKGRHFVDNIVAASEQMGRLIDDLLTYARTGRGAIRRDPVGLEPIIARLRVTYADRFVASGGLLEVIEPLSIPCGDPTLVEQILANLVGNALTYCRADVPPVVRVATHQNQGGITLSVTDNGIGIAPEHLERIFEVFARLHSDEEYLGTGIGLAIARKAARLMDGEITVESAVGMGSTFSLYLPDGCPEGARGG